MERNIAYILGYGVDTFSFEEAIDYMNQFEAMVDEKEYDEANLGEAIVFDDIFKQKNRKHCATLPYKGIRKALENYKK